MSTDQTFGHYALPDAREAIRAKANAYAGTRLGRALISRARKRAFKNLPDPFDVTVLPGVNARLWPRSNRCEKRAFAGVQVWDAQERAALIAAIDGATRAPFVFLDVGANVGLYSLILAAHAKQTDKAANIIAIEPDPTNRARLEFNIQASDANIKILPVAISDQPGSGQMGGGQTNRGEVRLMGQEADTPDTVEIKTLAQICSWENLSYIDAMQVDIEGYDLRALTAFFDTAPPSLWPDLLILETGRDANTPLLELCAARGYLLTKRAGINSILHLSRT